MLVADGVHGRTEQTAEFDAVGHHAQPCHDVDDGGHCSLRHHRQDRQDRLAQPLRGATQKSCFIVTFHSSHRLQNNLLVQITWQERKGAELDYLKKYGKEWKSSGGDQDPKKNNPSDDFLHRHPRYLDLVESPCQRQAKSATDLKFVIGSFWFCFQNTDHQKIQN